MTFEFRRATAADIPAMSAIRLAVRENALANPARITQQMYEDYLERLGRGWVCEREGVLIGFSYAAHEDDSIWALFVAPEYEGLGVGKRLLQLATDWLFTYGAQAVKLSTAVGSRADRFYLAQGWQRCVSENGIDAHFRLERSISIRRAGTDDLDAMWEIFQPLLVSGDAFPFGERFGKSTFQLHWFSSHPAYVACAGEQILGMYKMGANYPDHGAHVASATYAVATQAQGKGVGRALVEHSLAQARREGFLAMQFNYVVSSNAPAMALYRKLGFNIAGTLPRAFRHRELGLVDAYVLHRFLENP
ncbi:Ribosomal protein S18 acetylase RimI [Duganella sp. CF458]|uniref:GNAT family N-acetyltransferase n=1 Tax=Duganella sp. CF458 TaxID=1884368 RepID=UPI0008F0512A|nr:GNAT family N-acetyltransferase [Duganella sp. CF458]SFG00919.1 Ribosomal protein S18 acetylase RimI [Duganella sp. CF458]